MMERTGEIALQDEFQKQIEMGLGGGVDTQKVLLWNKDHAFLRMDPHTKRNRSMVVMGDVGFTSDTAYGETRNKICVNITGLVSSIYEVNKDSFNAWLKKYPDVTMSPYDLATLCASHLADLFENQHFDDKTGLWRMMLAFGEKFAWEQMAKQFNLDKDPRFIPAKLIAGAPISAEPLHYIVCHTSQHNRACFLDLVPQWLNEKVGDLSVQCQTLAHKLFQEPGNHHFWIRECPVGETTQEYPDFLLFVNGLPIVYVEMKTPDAGIAAAIKDFQIKPNYQGAPLCLASNGAQVIVTQTPQGRLESWVAYAGNMSNKVYPDRDNPLNAQQYFVEQILSRPKRLEFLITRCCSADSSGKLKVARAQQYQALARFEQDMQWSEIANTVLKNNGKEPMAFDNRLIRHTQRTGKTHTMIRAIHLALEGHSDLFRLSLLMVGEVQILGQIYSEIQRNIALGDNFVTIQRAESRKQLQDIIHQEANAQTHTKGKVILANMQKISQQEINSISIPDSNKTLVVLDEGHLAQTGVTSDLRDMLFPNAVHLLLTATPKSSMTQHYNITEDWHVLDDFGFGLAKASEMVCPVVFKRYTYSFNDNAARLGQLVESLKPALGDVSTSEIDEILQDEFDGEGSSKIARSLVQAVRRQLENDIIEERLNALTSELQKYENALEVRNGSPIFRPRALVFDRDTENAIAIIKFIQNKNKAQGCSDLNMYNGWRFGIDVSNFGKDTSGNDARTFQELNPTLSSQSDMESRLESMDPALRVDVLLAVGKYTKGYDNNQLAVVGLLRNIAEPSLMNQIYTRPATKREGKAKGVCLDLSFGKNNQLCWKESLRLYDKNVDLKNLLEQKDIDQLLLEVKTALQNACATLRIDLETLAKPNEVIHVLEQLTEDVKKENARNFVLQARVVTSLINTMPDSSIFGELRSPLVGLRCTLQNLQSMYPDLVKDESLIDGGVDAGYSPKKLGEIIRQALNVLGQSSLKALLDVRLHEGENVSPDSEEVLQAVQNVKMKNTRNTTITALEAVVGRKLPTHSSTVLFESLNRMLDRLRDDNQTVEQHKEQLQEACGVLKQLLNDTNDFCSAFYSNLDKFLLSKTAALDAKLEDVGLQEHGVTHDVLKLASSEMTNDFNQWFLGLSAQWVERSPGVLAQVWRSQYQRSSLADFVPLASAAQHIHGLDQSQWIESFNQLERETTRALLNDHSNELEEHSSLIQGVMRATLDEREVLRNAVAWCENASGER